jgi:hypothetical protein
MPQALAIGIGAEGLAPMVLSVLSGLLISDEMVDFLPVRFFWVPPEPLAETTD